MFYIDIKTTLLNILLISTINMNAVSYGVIKTNVYAKYKHTYKHT